MKVIDTCKRTLKFDDVMLEDNKLIDSTGNILTQISENMPHEVKYFTVQITAIMPSPINNNENGSDK